MGNSASLSTEIENNGTIYGGEKLKGKVLLRVRRAISAESLIFRFYGLEVTSVSTGSESPTYGETANIYSTEVILHRYDGGSVARGGYAFPFEVALPRGLPGSQVFNGKDGEKSSISHHCEVKLLRPGKLPYYTKNSCDVLMNDEPHVPVPTPMFMGPTSCKVSFMSVNPCGMISFGGKVNTISVCGNERFRLDCGICNQSTAHVKALEIVVKKITSRKAEGHVLTISHTVFERRIDVSRLVCSQPHKNKTDGAVDYGYVVVLEQIVVWGGYFH